MGEVGEEQLPGAWGPVLTERECLADIYLPLKSTTRIKYTSFDVSTRFLILGASSGSLFLFQRHPLQFLKVLPNKDGAVSQVCLAPDDNYIGYGTEKGLIIITEHNLERKGNHGPQRLHVSYDHKGAHVTALRWNMDSSRLFAGDDKGRVSVSNVVTSKAKLMFRVPSVIIMKLDSKVIQLDFAQNKLVASTFTRCYLCDTLAEQYSQIGKKLRDGEHGACFYNCSRVQTPSMYATRPGSRVWEIDYHGAVISTHSFKEALAMLPHRITFLNSLSLPLCSLKVSCQPQNTNFGLILTIGNNYLITWNESDIFIFNPANASLVLWTDSVGGIRSIRVFKTEMYVWFIDGTFRCFALVPAERFVAELYDRRDWLLCAEAACHYENAILAPQARRHITASMMKELAARLIEQQRDKLATQIEALATQIEADSGSMSSSMSGRSSADSSSRCDGSPFIARPSSGYTSDSDEFRHHPGRMTSRRSRTKSDRIPVSPFNPISPAHISSPPKLRQSPLKHLQSPSPVKLIPNGNVKHSEHFPEADTLSSINEISSVSTDKKSNTGTAKFQPKQNTRPTRSSIDSKVTQALPAKERIMRTAGVKSSASTLPRSRNVPSHKVQKPEKRYPKFVTPTLAVAEVGDNTKAQVSEKAQISTAKKTASKMSKLPRASPSFESEEQSCNAKSQDYRKKPGVEKRKKIDQTNYQKTQLLNQKVSGELISEETDSKPTQVPQPELKSNGISTPTRKTSDQIKDLKQDKLTEANNEPKTRQMTFAFPCAAYMQLGLLESNLYGTFDDYAVVNISAPASISEIRTAISSKISSGKDAIRQTIDETITVLKSEEEPYRLLNVGKANGKEILNALQIPEEPIVHSASNESPEERIGILIYRRNSMPVAPVDVHDFLLKSREVLATASRTIELNNHKNTFLQNWLVELEQLQCQIRYKIKEQIKLQIEDLKLNVNKLYSLIQKQSYFSYHSNHCKSTNVVPNFKHHTKDFSCNNDCASDHIAENMIFVEDPFQFSAEDHKMISELATLCFRLHLFANNNNVPSKGDAKSETDNENSVGLQPQEAEPAVNVEGGIFRTLKENESAMSFLLGSLDSKFKDWSDKVRKLDCIDHSDRSLCFDVAGAAFLRKFFHFLDFEETHSVLVKWDTSRFATWLSLLEGAKEVYWEEELFQHFLEGKDLSAILDQTKGRIKLLVIAKRLMVINPAVGIDICVRHGSLVSALDVLFMCRLTRSPAYWFEQFLNRMATSGGYRVNSRLVLHMKKVVRETAADDEVALHWAALLLTKGHGMQTKLKCSCGYPRPWAHQWLWPQGSTLWLLLKNDNRWSELLAICCYWCGFWPGFLMYCKRHVHYNKILIEIIVQLGDIRLLSNNIDFGFLPGDLNHWKLLLSTIAKQQQHLDFISCLHCKEIMYRRSPVSSPSDRFVTDTVNHALSEATRRSDASKFVIALERDSEQVPIPPSISWTNVVHLILQHLPPSEALALLREAVVQLMPPGSLSPQCLRTVLLAFSLRLQKKSSLTFVSNSDLFRRYQKPKCLGPELNHLFQAEKQQLISEQASKSVAPANETTLHSEQQFPEKFRCHWGAAVKLHDECSTCRLSLSLGTSSVVQGIIVLNCGHVFHQGCLEKCECVVCYADEK